MKVLFLDDDPVRRRIARAVFAREIYSESETAESCIRMLDKYSPYDLVMLDHDLGGETFVPSNEKSGYHVAQYIAKMPKDKLPGRVVIHSYNAGGAKNMLEALSPFVEVVYEPFNLNNLEILRVKK